MHKPMFCSYFGHRRTPTVSQNSVPLMPKCMLLPLNLSGSSPLWDPERVHSFLAFPLSSAYHGSSPQMPTLNLPLCHPTRSVLSYLSLGPWGPGFKELRQNRIHFHPHIPEPPENPRTWHEDWAQQLEELGPTCGSCELGL